jgi:hypothetical protein
MARGGRTATFGINFGWRNQHHLTSYKVADASHNLGRLGFTDAMKSKKNLFFVTVGIGAPISPRNSINLLHQDISSFIDSNQDSGVR